MPVTEEARSCPDGVASEASLRRLGHQPAFDGVRGVAWLVVFSAHAFDTKPFAIGQPAMFVFFALSGFLITELLVEEWGRAQVISLRNFFARRALRLLPALVLFLFVWLTVILVADGHASWTATVPGGGNGPGTSPLVGVEGVGGALGYVTNWLEIFNVYSGYFPLGHLWSLAIEEQFYVLWAPLVALVLAWRGRKAAAWVAAVLAVLSLTDATIVHGGTLCSSTEMGTGARAGAFLIGAALAFAWSRRARWVAQIAGRWRSTSIGVALVVMLWASWVFDRRVTAHTFDSAWVAVSLASGLLVVAVVAEGSQRRRGLLASPVLMYLGRRSYALYLWHYVWLTWLAGHGLAGVIAAFGASLASAEVSWQLVERRALARKARFSRRPSPQGRTRVPQDVDEEPHDVAAHPRGRGDLVTVSQPVTAAADEH